MQVCFTAIVMLLLASWQPRALAQAGQWAWIDGNQGTNNAAVTYGTKSVPSTQNLPAERYGSGTWRDANGNLWLFGGYGLDSTSYAQGYLNDVWTYNIAQGTWTWVNGSNVVGPNYAQSGVYGTLGVPSSTNAPGGRFAPSIWQDSSGNVWMFGGSGQDSTGTTNGNGPLNDLWLYNPTTNIWTWMGGSTTISRFNTGQPGVYGTLGTAASGNMPGGRYGAATWTDQSGNFWLFGGAGTDANGINGSLNDLWMFSPGTKLWTWEGGSNTGNATGVYGAQGVPSASNIPNPRNGAFTWTDPKGNFWLFSGATAMNDLWMFNPATKQWTFMSGSATAGAAGSYGTQGVAAGTNLPPGRDYGSAWTDAAGNLWLLGGIGLGTPNDGRLRGYDGSLNDEWMYNAATNQWTWVAGSNGLGAGGSYGTEGQPSSTNIPGNRRIQDFWTDTQGNFWLFGGYYLNLDQTTIDYDKVQFYSDLWKQFAPSVTNSGPVASLSPFGLQFTVIAGQTSSAQQITLSNPGTAPLSISGVTMTGTGASDYQQSNTCGASLAVGSNCTISVTFAPLQAGNYPATLTLADSAPGSPLTVALNGFAQTTTTTALSGTLSVVTTDASDTLTVTVARSSGSGTPTGTVTLLTSGSTVATLTLGTSGTATYTVNQPPVGSATYTAQYRGDSNYAASTSGSFTLTSIIGPTTSAPPWTWLNGVSTPYTSFPSGYPTIADPAGQGVASASNYPGIRYDALTWADPSGNLYLFGGEDFDDLWKYNTSGGAWTFLKGSFAASMTGPLQGVYGTIGVPGSANNPGARTNALRWIDGSGNLWLFGGNGPDSTDNFGALNDLWMYSPATNNWTWMGGDQVENQAGVYGSVGVAAATNKPGGRYSAATWVDASGNFWMFGGFGYDSTGTGNFLNDVWMYNVSTNQWTWEGGPSQANAAVDTYTVQGVAAPGNTPSVRTNAMTWVDTSGKLWLFGGNGYGATTSSSGDLNDLWVFDPALKQWAFMGGTLTPYSAGTYGTLGTASTNDVPAARESGASFTDARGNFWLFGGTQSTVTNLNVITTPYNDLWKYSPTQNLWTWVAGSNAPSSAGAYGTQGTGSTANIPAARANALSWTDNAGNFWLLGGTNVQPYGQQFVAFDDLWRAVPAATTGTPVVSLSPTSLSFSSAVGTAAASQTITLTNTGTTSLSLSSIAFGTNDLSSFSSSYTCTGTLAAGASCSISVTFTPHLVMSYSGSIVITDSASNSPQTIPLTGTGTAAPAPVASFSPLSLAFPSTATGATSAALSTTLTNSGNATLTGITPTIIGTNPGDFAISANTCGSSLAASASCILSISFTPASAASFAATLSVANNAAGSPQSVSLSGASGGATGGATAAWAWVGGTQGGNAGGTSTYGTQGVASVSNTPGGRLGSTTWTDANGNFWLFGGLGYDLVGAYGELSDLWMLTPTTGAWTWIGGNQTVAHAGVYGTKGTASASNNPGGRYDGASWVDSHGNFWLFGGSGYASTTTQSNYPIALNDLWMYNPSTNQWTWEGGSNTFTASITGSSGVYGTQGTSSTGNIPGGRFGSVTWVDAQGNFRLFGGQGQDVAGNPGYLNDLWTYNPNSGAWTWQSGSSSLGSSRAGNGLYAGQPGNYGTQGAPASANVPGGRQSATGWTDASGNLWLFGGLGADSTDLDGYLNDLWMYAPSSNQWTWVKGNTTVGANGGQVGVYGTQGTASSSSNPGGRAFHSAWTDLHGNFWLFGGTGIDSVSGPGNLNDLWEYVPSANTWTWVTGSNLIRANGVYGPFDVAGAAYTPGSRYSAATWTDKSGNLWLYDGYSSAITNSIVFNDVWLFGVPTFPPPTQQLLLSATNLLFSGGAGTPSAPQTVTVTNIGTASVTITGIALSAGTPTSFGTSNTCAATLAAGASCSVKVTFTPAAATGYTGSVVLTDSASSAPQMVTLLGSGVGCAYNPATPYTNCNPGTTTTITNSRTEQLTFAPPTVTTANATAVSTEIVGKYNGAVVYDQIFASAYGTPTVQAGITSANSAIAAAGGSSVVIPPPALTSSSTQISAASTSTYSVAQPQASTTVSTVTSTNTFGPATIMAASAAGNPANPTVGQVSQCTEASLPSSTMPTCMPTNAGTFQIISGQLDVNVNTDSNYLINTATTTTTTTTTVAAYAITGTSTAPTVSLTPTGPLSFSASVGTTSDAQVVTILNSGTASLSLTGISLTGANAGSFAATNNCGASLAANGSCMVSVKFSPGAAGGFTAALLIADSAIGSPQSVTINGTGTAAPAPAVSLTPGPLSFTSVVGTPSAAQLATLTNTGNATLNISSIAITGGSGFADTTNCGGTLNTGSSCTISITFMPSGTSSVTAALAVNDNATGSPHAVTLMGVGTIASAPVVSLSPSSLTFSALSGTASAAQSITLQNTGNATLNIGSIVLGGTNASVFADTTVCGTTLNAGASCTIAVTFNPTSTVAYSATLSVADNASGSPQSVTLNGTGTATPSFTLSSIQPTQAVVPGSAAVYTLTVTPQNGAFAGTVSLSANGLPAGATASFSPTTLTPGSSAATSTLTVQTTTSIVKTDSPSRLFGWKLGTPTLAFFILWMRPRRRFRRGLMICLLALAALGVSLGLSGCGGTGFRLPESANTTFNFTVTAASGTQQQTITVQLTVQ
jgi:N-acetylneuraminic acid mutarotase